MILSPSQKQTLKKLLPIAHLATKVDTSDLPISVRTHSLICGPSGVGKSHLMRALGQKLDVPVLFINVSNWQPLGGKGDEPTWESIVDFLKLYPSGIILLDEIDKIHSEDSNWMGHIRTELFDLLDGRIPTSVSVDGSNDLW